jgi:hypothetical protein
MRDFTFEAYRSYLQAIKASYPKILTFADFFSLAEPPDSFAIIRHDVDRKPKNAFKMAILENKMGIRSTYYFRTKSHVFKPEIISQIAAAGHEIGYHYESLSDAAGDHKSALTDFEQNLEKLRKIAPIKTIAMHGSPLSRHDNRNLWKNQESRVYLKNSLDIHGEVYLDINYSAIAYITDTGRNWSSGRANRRDNVISTLTPDFKNGWTLLDCFEKADYPRIVFQIHPERWADSYIEYCKQITKDQLANLLKAIVR